LVFGLHRRARAREPPPFLHSFSLSLAQRRQHVAQRARPATAESIKLRLVVLSQRKTPPPQQKQRVCFTLIIYSRFDSAHKV
jgi:hypothetical protein